MPSTNTPGSRPQADQPDSIGGLLRHTSIYAITPIFQRLLGLVLVGIYTSVLPTGEYGLLGLTDLFLALFPLLIGTSLLAGLSRHYFIYEDPKDRSSVISGTAIALIISSTLGTIAVLVFREPITGLLFAVKGHAPNEALVTYVSICALILPFSLISRTGFEALQAQKRSKAVVVLSLVRTVLESTLKLYFLFGMQMGVLGFLYAILIGEVLSGSAFAVYIARVHGVRLVGRTFKPLLLYTIPLVPVGLFQLCLHQADKLLLQRLGPTDVVGVGSDGVPLTLAREWLGVYNLGYQIPFLFHAAVMGSFMRIWSPNIFALKNDAASREDVLRIGTLVALAIGGLYAQVALFGREAIQIIGRQESYHAANEIVPWIAFGYVAFALYGLCQAALMSVFAVRSLAALNAFALAVNLGLNFLWIPEYGYLGAAMATTASFAALALTSAVLSARKGIPPFSATSVVTGLLLVAGAAAAGVLIDQSTAPWAIGGLAAKVGVSLTLVGLLFLSLPSRERALLLSRIQRAR
ncbi:MAG: polysaccharide biosynthesis C-terminal domain-containing protein [Planctomycetota bacterium]|nr:polysaccharide biosynthesis C-terminal domain-containing protein [Planctomycetota bacterium]MDG1985911.1 polysaccharide biosynthesis C-terminal domain-containing protein [Planctomycetota bacterium]